MERVRDILDAGLAAQGNCECGLLRVSSVTVSEVRRDGVLIRRVGGLQLTSKGGIMVLFGKG
jgi:hypothetical protein